MSTFVRDILAQLARKGKKKNVEGMARFGIVARKVYGVSVADVRVMAKKIGRDHRLADALWRTGWQEAKQLAAFVDDPKLVTSTQMNRWAKSFENWADCDTVCFHLFDKTPLAWRKIDEWSSREEEFVKRAAFATLAAVALHDKKAEDQRFLDCLDLIEKAASDERNFVKKGVSWALRGIGHRNPSLQRSAMLLAKKLASSDNKTERWVGKDVLRDLSR
jgi:3-methyladenine DNA glycosylase AlkD